MWRREIQYQRLESLGEGGQGRVFKALRIDRATGLSATVALKILHSETAVDLWKSEFESLRRVRSLYCVQVLSFDRVRGRPSLVLEYVDGVSLSHLGRASYLQPEDVKEISAQVQLGLSDLKNFGMTHGDLSPANVLLDRDGRIRLLDFGLANHGGPQARLTPDFSSPSRLMGKAPTFDDDLFSLARIEAFLLGSEASEKPIFLGQRPCGEAQRRLAHKVSELLDRQSRAKHARTRTLQILLKPRYLSRKLTAAIIALSFSLSASTAASKTKTEKLLAKLSVRTLHWHHLTIDGVDVGYAPADIVVSTSRQIHLGWKNARGTGHRQLQLAPGQHLLLEDRDLTGRDHAGTGGTPSNFGNAGGRADEGQSNRGRGRRVYVQSGN